MSDTFFNLNGIGASQHAYMYGGLTESISVVNTFQLVSLNNVGSNAGIVVDAVTNFDATIQEDGAYLCMWGANFDRAGGSDNNGELMLFKNGSQQIASQAIFEIGWNNTPVKLVGFGIFNFVQGDVIDLRAAAGNTASRLVVVNGVATTDFSSFLSISKL